MLKILYNTSGEGKLTGGGGMSTNWNPGIFLIPASINPYLRIVWEPIDASPR